MATKKIQVTLKKSVIGYNERQRKTLVGLGLRRLNRPKVLTDTPAVRGMIAKVSHLVSVQDVK